MIDPHPPNDDKYGLRRTGPQPKDDGYKILIIKFLHDEAVEATFDLRGKEIAIHYKYIGVRRSQISNALVSVDGKARQLIGAGDDRLPKILSELEKLKLIEKKEWDTQKWTKTRNYYTLTEDGEKMWDDIQKLKTEKISKLLYCSKFLDVMIQRYGSTRLVEKFSLEKV